MNRRQVLELIADWAHREGYADAHDPKTMAAAGRLLDELVDAAEAPQPALVLVLPTQRSRATG